MGKEKYAMVVLEAVQQLVVLACRIWFCDFSPLHTHVLDGSHAKIDFDYSIGEFKFNKCFYLVDGYYPQLTQFVKTISIPLTKKEKQFPGWQEAARKDVKRAFGVLQSRWCLLAGPIEKWDEVRIQHMVIACLIMHNMMVEERLDHGDGIISDYFDDENNNKMDEDSNVLDEAEEFVHMMEAEMHHSQHSDPTTQFLQDHMDFWTQTHTDGDSRLMGMPVQ